ncbi:hypothetical protein [Leucobacter coleopterorum]|uniref:hypothetical protein n=1 Tax=Leucobacter coleopterorum TaxID=2714933 RepID=UPI00197D45FD|nr:hypothetical protein [Leucobacter coleopterorum]
MSIGHAFRLSIGERLTLGAPKTGLRSVLALRGGVAAAPVLGSRSYDTLARLGPAPLAAGDTVDTAGTAVLPVGMPEASDAKLPIVGEETTLRVILGPRENWFDAASLAQFAEQSWEVASSSDRVGVRFGGEALTRSPSLSAGNCRARVWCSARSRSRLTDNPYSSSPTVPSPAGTR